MHVHPVPLSSDFRSQQERQQLETYCRSLQTQMRILNEDASWVDEYFTPLDAQVEVGAGRGLVRKVDDLLTAIKDDKRSRIFLVLGEPGGGKSVALRTLAVNLLSEVKLTSCIPIYVNLKEWKAGEPWTEEKPPTVIELVNFLVLYMKERSDVLSKQFIDSHFYAQLEKGRFYFIFDSFDEIPQVLDSDERSWIIRELSQVIVRFFDSAPNMQGVIGSREFKQPRLPSNTHRVLKIIPFSEYKIRDAFVRKQYCNLDLLTLMFRERLDLVALSRNPFTAAMIADYMIGEGRLPRNQGDVFLNYITKRLNGSSDRMAQIGITLAEVEDGAISIAQALFSMPGTGLEAGTATLQTRQPAVRIEHVATILTYARIGRYGPMSERRFSFIHRRFHEYFLVRALLAGRQEVAMQAIPTDSRWRDALVLYCSVAAEPDARAVAHYCWQHIRRLEQADLISDRADYMASVHCLRFLGEAFRYRREILAEFQSSLAQLIARKVEPDNDMLVTKIAVEVTGTLADADVETVVQRALSLDNSWISETAVKSCRHLPTIADATEARLIDYLLNIPLVPFIRRYRELSFSLSLSDAFSRVSRALRLRRLEMIFMGLSAILLILTQPGLTLVLVGAAGLGALTGGIFLNLMPSHFGHAVWMEIELNRMFQHILTPLLIVGGLSIAVDSIYPFFTDDLILKTMSLSAIDFVFSTSLGNAIKFSIGITIVMFSLPFLRVWHLYNFVKSKDVNIKEMISIFVRFAKELLVFIKTEGVRLFFSLTRMLLLVGLVVGLLGAAMFLIVGGMLWVIDQVAIGFPVLGSTIKDLARKPLLIVGFFLAVLGIFSAIATARSWLADRERFRRANFGTRAERTEVEKAFLGFVTPYWRRRLVEDLRARQVELVGVWSTGKIPNVRNDAGSIILAQWEERNYELG